MSWYRGTQWLSEPGKELVLLMARAFPTGPDMLDLLRDVKRESYNYSGNATIKLAWTEVLRGLTQDGELDVLLRHVVAVRPPLEAAIDELGRADTAARAQAVPADDPYHVLLIDPGRLPMVDRDDLRREFQRFLESSYPALLVVGADQSGKTHSRELFRHVVDRDERFELKQVDFSSTSSGDDGTALLSLLCRRLGLEDVTRRVSRTTATRHAIDLVDDLVGIYHAPETRRRVIVVDGLNRKDLEPDVHKVAAKLVTEVVHGNLPDTQLVLAGYVGALEPQTRWRVLTETIQPITESHVRIFLKALGLQFRRELSDAELDELVATVMAGAPALAMMAERVRAEALKLEAAV